MANIVVKNPTVAQYLGSVDIKRYIEGVLKERAGQFVTSLVSMANLTPGLKLCDPETLMYCGLKAASLNLPLDNNLGFAYAVPYGKEAQFQIGYKGLVQLGQRTGQYKNMNVINIHQGELISWDPFAEELELAINQDQEARAKLPVIGYAAVFTLLNGFKKICYWPEARVEAHAKRFSKAYNGGPWKTDFHAMARKTVLKDMLSHWGPLSTEMAEAVKFDQSVIRKTDAGEEYPDYIDGSLVDDVQSLPESSVEAEFKAEQERKKAFDAEESRRLDAELVAREGANA